MVDIYFEIKKHNVDYLSGDVNRFSFGYWFYSYV